MQYGKCSNRVGCSLAYTGEAIRFEGEPRCPECGRPLEIQQPPRAAKSSILIASGLLLLILGAAGTGAYLYFKAHQGPPAPPPGTPAITEAEPHQAVSPAQADTIGPAMVETDDIQLPPDLANVTAPSSVVPSPTNNPTPPAPANTDSFQAEQTAVPQTPLLSKAEVDATRSDVLKRISAMPKMGAQEKERLAEKVETARSMERLQIIRFDLGKTTLPKAAADQLATIFNKPEMKDRLSDPTLVFVVAGYADSGGDTNTNLRISQDRADSIGKFLKQQIGILNVVHTIGMGSTNLLDSKRPDQNRAAEIWAVVP